MKEVGSVANETVSTAAPRTALKVVRMVPE
jgi:hypothetical protein